MSFKKIQEVNLSRYYIEKSINGLNKVINYLKDINLQYILINKNLKDYINDNITFPLDLSNNFNKEINKYIEWLNHINKNDKEKYINEYEENYNDLINIFNKYYEKISLFYTNTFIKKVSDLNENIKNLIDDLSQFDPPNINNYSNFNVNIDSKFEEESILNQFYEEPDENRERQLYGSQENIISTNSDENENSLKCYNHLDQKGIYYCSHCDFIFCEFCGKNILNFSGGNNHVLEKINEMIERNEEDKNKFLKSFMTLFKDYLLKCNFIMNHKNINYIIHQSVVKKFVYPFLQNETNFKNQMNFLNDINEAYKRIEQKMDTKNNSLKNSKINNLLNEYLKKDLNINIKNIEEI